MNLTVVSAMKGYAASAVGRIVIESSASVRLDIDADDNGSIEDIQYTTPTSLRGQAAVCISSGNSSDCSWALLIQSIPV